MQSCYGSSDDGCQGIQIRGNSFEMFLERMKTLVKNPDMMLSRKPSIEKAALATLLPGWLETF